MTRREREILKKSVSWTDKSLTVNEEKAFQAGAKWADKTIIDKACEWLDNYLMEIGYPDDWMRDSPNMESGKERFRKAMEE